MIIKPIEDIHDIRQVAEVEAETWGMKFGETVPDHVLTAIAREGGVLLGAYQENRLIGFTLGWLGIKNSEQFHPAADQLKLVSHMTGVLAEFRDQRIGFQLKLAQREWALSQGLDLITWTYDPLESRNSYFNIHLLGCVCNTYLRDYYGEMSDQMNQGIPSDRLKVDWRISSQEVDDCLAEARDQTIVQRSIPELIGDGYQLISTTVDQSGGNTFPGSLSIQPTSHQVLVEIPADYQAVRGMDLELALSWRHQIREILESLFKSAYKITDFIYQKTPTPRSFYYLENPHED